MSNSQWQTPLGIDRLVVTEDEPGFVQILGDGVTKIPTVDLEAALRAANYVQVEDVPVESWPAPEGFTLEPPAVEEPAP